MGALNFELPQIELLSMHASHYNTKNSPTVFQMLGLIYRTHLGTLPTAGLISHAVLEACVVILHMA